MAGLPSLLLTLFSTAVLATPSFKHTKSIQWGSCLDQIRCTNLTLPLNWDKPNGKQINVGIGMLPVADKSKRIGYLFTNPGGPGNSAIEDLSSNAGFWKSTKLHQYFDIIAPDPRGTAYSTPIRCDPAAWNVRVAEIPSTEAEFYHLNKTYTEMGGSCAKASGDILNHVDTVSVARDFEAIRIALGDEPMNYLGFSYGAQLGAQYAEYFPKNIRALAIDGILDHSIGFSTGASRTAHAHCIMNQTSQTSSMRSLTAPTSLQSRPQLVMTQASQTTHAAQTLPAPSF